MKTPAITLLGAVAVLSLVARTVMAVAVPHTVQAPLVSRDSPDNYPPPGSDQCHAIKQFITTEVYRRCLFFRVNILSNPLHCGSCFNVCSGDSPYCASGKCRNNPPVLVKFRIEGNEQDGTLFEGEIATAGHDVSTPLGGTHHCDGTNDNASPTRGGTFTSALDEAARLNRFDFDGTFYPTFDDYFIRRIANSSETFNQYWGFTRNGILEDSGGCQEKVIPGDDHLWAFDVFRPGVLVLSLSGSSLARLGKSVTYTVLGRDPQLGTTVPVEGAKVFDQYTDANGHATVTFHQRCVFPLKATKDGMIRSNAIWTAVI